MFLDIIFFVVSFLLVLGSLSVLLMNNVYRSAAVLALVMLCFAAMYFLMSAEFIGVIQILVYVGAVSVLIALSVMLVKNIEKSTQSNNMIKVSAPFIALIAISFMIFIANIDWNTFSANLIENSDCLLEACGEEPAVLVESTYWLGKLIVTDFIIAFQLCGLILLASLIGALALLRIRIKNESN